ncbi:glycosyltransferase family 9 protein [Arthrobacter echini]|uniref:Glycosyltransferase family 9 protein n=1 Tax=Arthrobacter echini TaxID=1529066 RepID=A0A4S5E468_9MICC|nr:glycosyltransferase family 9 protein [Arthrobacter echini]THJ66254.1 glycosyltransferase family 9 protein [Arthrobacter echini]
MQQPETTAAFGGRQDPGRSVGPLLAPFEDIRTIAVLRGGGLGDLMFALPAIAALKNRYPEAVITLLGMPAHAALLTGREASVSEVVELPVHPGVRPGESDPAAVEQFFDTVRGSFDLAVQLHGGGRNSNPFLLRLEARHTIGTRTHDAVALERTIPYVYYQQEVFRALEVVGLAGAAPVEPEARLSLTARDAERAGQLLGPGPVIALHPGATDPRRRWPSSSFAEVAVRAAADGCEVVVVGDASDVPAAEEIVRLALAQLPTASVRSLAGRLDLGELLGVLGASTVVVGNDSGPRHLAQALGTPTVGVFWIGNVINAGPVGRTLHRLHFSWVTHCPTCGADLRQVGWTAERCEHDDSLVASVQPGAVYADVAELRATSLLLRGR